MRSALGRLADDVSPAGSRRTTGRSARRGTSCSAAAPHPRRGGRRTARGGRGGKPLAAGRRLALRLDATVLPVQGPPGTGKTHTGARRSWTSSRPGRRVGVTAQSHRVIANLLEAVAKASRRRACRSASPSARTTTTSRAMTSGSSASGPRSGPSRGCVQGPGTWSAGRPGCGRTRTRPTPSTSCSSMRPASCHWRRCAASAAPPGRWSCWAIRTSYRRCHRASTRTAPAPPRWSTWSARRGPSPRIAGSCSGRRTGCTRM